MFKHMLDLDWAKVMRDAIRKSTLVNCWYLSDYESAAMWTTYGKDGIALKSTVCALKASLEAEERPAGLATVKYTPQRVDGPPLTQDVNPLAEPWLRNVLETEAKRYGLDKSVVQSSLYDPV